MSEAGGHVHLAEKIGEMIHEYRDDSSSSDSDDEPVLKVVAKKLHLFGRTEPLHAVLGGGKSADVMLWRNKQTSAGIFAGVTLIWILFEWMGYHLLTLVCHTLIFSLTVLFLWSNTSSFFKKSPPKFPEVILPEAAFLDAARVVRYQINEAFATFHNVASGKDLKKFLMVLAGLWVVSVVGSWFNFLTLFYIVFVIIYTGPLLYEKYEDDVDRVGEKALLEINKHYAVLNEKVLKKIPKASFLDKSKQL